MHKSRPFLINEGSSRLALSSIFLIFLVAGCGNSPKQPVPSKAMPTPKSKKKKTNRQLHDEESQFAVAIIEKDDEKIERLLDLGVDPNGGNELGVRALNYAAEKGNAKLVKKLLQLGADPNHRNLLNQLPLTSAGRSNSKDCIELLIKHGARVPPKEKLENFVLLKSEIYELRIKLYEMCLSKKLMLKAGLWNIESQDQLDSQLRLFAISGRPKGVKAFIQYGANVNARIGSMPLIITAIMGENSEVIDLFLENGADPNPKGKYSPLLSAVRYDQPQMVKSLISKGALVDYVSEKDGMGVLHMASDKRVVEILLEKGAPINIRDKKGRTPLDMKNSEEVKNLLKKFGGKTSKELDSP